MAQEYDKPDRVRESLIWLFISNEEIFWASAEGYLPHGDRRDVKLDETPYDRAVDMLLMSHTSQKLRTNQELVTGMHAFFKEIGIEEPIWQVQAAAWWLRFTFRNITEKSAD